LSLSHSWTASGSESTSTYFDEAKECTRGSRQELNSWHACSGTPAADALSRTVSGAVATARKSVRSLTAVMLLVRVIDADADSEAVPVTDGEAGALCVDRGRGRGNGATSDTEEGMSPQSAAAASR